MKKAAIIVAGGFGSRIGGDIPKQFQLIGGKPIVLWALEAFYRFDPEMTLILVIPSQHFSSWESIKNEFNPPYSVTLVKGGEERFYSVQNGISALGDEELIAIHDGVRPFIDEVTIRRCFEAADKTGTAVPVIESVDSIRLLTPDGSRPLKRKDVKRVQTPQIFKRDVLIKGYSQPYKDVFTDDASVIEVSGTKITLIEGNKMNIKITTPDELLMASIVAEKWTQEN
jgi:4-diphosphocytidyl-2-methyl-D-erithritol synthase